MYHGPINSTYGEVWWTRGSNPMPEVSLDCVHCVLAPRAVGSAARVEPCGNAACAQDVVKRFDGKVMAIVGIEMDQVRKTPDGDVSVPITLA